MQGRDKPFCTNISGNAGGFGFRFRSAGADCWSLWCRISFLADPGRFLFCFRWLSFGNPLCDFLHTIRGGTIRFPVAIMFIIFRYRFYNFIQCCLGVWIYNVSYFQYYTTVTTKLVLYSLYLIHGCFGPPQAENFGGFTKENPKIPVNLAPGWGGGGGGGSQIFGDFGWNSLFLGDFTPMVRARFKGFLDFSL